MSTTTASTNTHIAFAGECASAASKAARNAAREITDSMRRMATWETAEHPDPGMAALLCAAEEGDSSPPASPVDPINDYVLVGLTSQQREANVCAILEDLAFTRDPRQGGSNGWLPPGITARTISAELAAAACRPGT